MIIPIVTVADGCNPCSYAGLYACVTCSLYEVKRAKDFQKLFELVTDEGSVSAAGHEVLMQIGERLLDLRAASANASCDLDKKKILYRILNSADRNKVSTFGMFCQYGDSLMLDKSRYTEFDAHVCSLLSTSMLKESLKVKDAQLALGLGAPVTVEQLVVLEGLGADVHGDVNTQDGTCALSLLMAAVGNVNALCRSRGRGLRK